MIILVSLLTLLPATEVLTQDESSPAPPVSGMGIGFPHGVSLHSEPWLQGQVGMRLALDYRGFDSRNSRDSGVTVDVLEVRGTIRALDAWVLNLVGDLRGVDSRDGVKEAWLGYESPAGWRARAGLLPTTIGVESSLPDGTHAFIGKAFPSALDRKTDYGVTLEGELSEGLLSGALWGNLGDGFDSEGQRRADPQLGLRLMAYPLRTAPVGRGLFLNVGWSYAPSFEGQLDVRHPYRPTIFQVPRLEGDETQFRSIGLGWDAGRLRFIHEWVEGGIRDLEVPGGGEADLNDQITAWQASLCYRVFGPDYDTRLYRQIETVQARLDPRDESILELAVRYSNADIDRRFFDLGFTSFTQSSQEFRIFTAAVNYYPRPYLRLSAEVTRTLADQFPAVFDSHGRDTSFILRAQLEF